MCTGACRTAGRRQPATKCVPLPGPMPWCRRNLAPICTTFPSWHIPTWPSCHFHWSAQKMCANNLQQSEQWKIAWKRRGGGAIDRNGRRNSRLAVRFADLHNSIDGTWTDQWASSRIAIEALHGELWSIKFPFTIAIRWSWLASAFSVVRVSLLTS